jgi:CheY-like chemotaxis protein
MDGTIAVESRKGVGTVFTLTFPLIGAEAARPVAVARPRVLVVDDNEQARAVAERVLDAHYAVATAVSGPDALARARASRPDAVLLDIHLGDTVSGEDVLRDLRADPALADLPVVAVTAYGLPGDRARFLALGFDDYITKPYTRERLLQALGDSLARTGAAVSV